ncbi:protein kinase domain-containing protein [Geothrix fermentans]|uniref:protein kinase domain-containing protein n=1 Tax=Geothrix fermentans TaxID=44676 RepID=UPI000402572D|nr:protein kinase [Geothrix fermentans]
MPRPLLLIVDGESLRTPGLVSAMEADGWDVQWIRHEGTGAFLEAGRDPDLLILDAAAAGAEGDLIRRLREQNPRLPVLVLVEGPEAGDPSGSGVQEYLERTLPDPEIAAVLRRYRPGSAKLTTTDIFGDLLADLEGGQEPAASPAEPPLAAPPAGQPPLSAAEIFGRVIEEVEALPEPAPVRNLVRVVPALAAAPASTPASAPASALAAAPTPEGPLGPSDFTLSDISGVNDPFAWSGGPAEAPGTAPEQEAKPVAAGAPEILEEYGNYFLLEKIAIGGMAELFKAQQRGVQGFQKIVAIKRILPHFSDNEDFVTMFIDEAKLAAQLTHPNIVQIFDLGKAGSSYYIAMEYVNGRDLRTLLRKVRELGRPFPEQVAAFVVMKVAAALDYAHRKRGFDDRELKLVHRDISPQNVILSTEGAVKLVDFGIAKAASKASHTVAGALKGKLLYMSPEQATGQPLDNRSDLYSLGLVLFELLTGERCFQADSELGVLEKVRLGRVSDLLSLNPKVSKEMAAIVSRALQKGVDHRYPSARFMERDLRDYLLRLGTPVTEHDVAEYMQALLHATPENLDHLVATKFPPPTTFSSGAHRNLGLPADTLIRTAPAPQEALEHPEEALDPIEPLPDTAPRPRWMLPAILGLAAVLVALLVIARWS